MLTPLHIIRDFYAARARGDVEALRAFIANDVCWREPTVGDHMGELNGADAVIDMISRALATTGGTFALEVGDGVEVDGHCSVVINWSAEKSGSVIHGRELATYSIVDGKIVAAQFLPENIRHDTQFWAQE